MENSATPKVTVIRPLFAIGLGGLAASVIFLAFGCMGLAIWPLPKQLMDALTASNPDALKNLSANSELYNSLGTEIPLASHLCELAGTVSGSILGGWLAVRLLAKKSPLAGNVVGITITLGNVLSLSGLNHSLPRPLWVNIIEILLVFPSAYLGSMIAVLCMGKTTCEK